MNNTYVYPHTVNDEHHYLYSMCICTGLFFLKYYFKCIIFEEAICFIFFSPSRLWGLIQSKVWIFWNIFSVLKMYKKHASQKKKIRIFLPAIFGRKRYLVYVIVSRQIWNYFIIFILSSFNLSVFVQDKLLVQCFIGLKLRSFNDWMHIFTRALKTTKGDTFLVNILASDSQM